MRRVATCVLLLASLAACTPEAPQAPGWRIEKLVEGSAFHGVHGITTDADDHIYVGSVVGQSIYEVDRETGETRVHVGPPLGIADDLEFGPDGTLAWSGIFVGKVFARSPAGEIRVLAEGLPAINSIAFAPDGRLFATEVFGGDALYEIDRTGAEPAREIMRGMGGLNGFDFGPDGKLYGPIWFKGQVARVDVDAGTLEVVADGFGTPAAANFDSQGNLYVVDTELGQVLRVDVATGQKTLVAQVRPGIDNLTIDSRDRIYITNMSDNAVIEIDPETGSARTLLQGELATPGDIALDISVDVALGGDGEQGGRRERLHVADVFAHRTVDTSTGQVRDVSRVQAHGNPTGVSIRGDRVVLASWASGTVQVFERESGALLRELDGFGGPGDALLLPDGSLVVTELASNSLVHVTGDAPEDRSPLATGLQGPACLVQAGDAALYVTEVTGGRVLRVDTGSGAIRVVAAGLSGPEGIDLLPDGRLVVAEAGARRIIAIDPESGAVEVLGEDLPLGLPAIEGMPPLHVVSGVAASPDGSVYFTSDLENAIYRLVPPG